MVSNDQFRAAVNVLDILTSTDDKSSLFRSESFSKEYSDQHPVTTAIKTLNKAVQEGSNQQKNELFASRNKIQMLNESLTNQSISALVQSKLKIEMGEEADKIKGMTIAQPKSNNEQMTESVTYIPRQICATLMDIALLPAAGILIIVAATCKPKFDPETPKTDLTPILLLHGSGFNETEWILGRQYLKKENYGSVFSLNIDGLASNDPKMGIDDYAGGKVREKIKKIAELTKQNRIILIGHSMGGLIGGYYAEYFSKEDGIDVEHVISIGTPWKGAPLLGKSETNKSKRYQQMSCDSPFLKELVSKALCSERAGIRNYYNSGASTDFIVPGSKSNITEDPRRQRNFNLLGHYSLICSPSLWKQIRVWLDFAYELEVQAKERAKIVQIQNTPSLEIAVTSNMETDKKEEQQEVFVV